jgi:hypothetical protein
VRLTSQNCGLYGPIVHFRVICDVDHGRMILIEANSQLVYQSAVAATSSVRRFCQQRHLWQPPVLSGGPTIRDISGASGRVGGGNENLVSPSPWDLKRSFTCLEIFRHGTTGCTSHPKEGVLRILIAFKSASLWPGSNLQTLGPSASTLATTPPRQHVIITISIS